jgi:hypothetical protein
VDIPLTGDVLISDPGPFERYYFGYVQLLDVPHGGTIHFSGELQAKVLDPLGQTQLSYDFNSNVSPTPEPSSAVLAIIGAAVTAIMTARRWKNAFARTFLHS